MSDWLNLFVLKRANISQNCEMEKVGAKNTVGVNVPAASRPEVKTLVILLLAGVTLVFLALVILRRKEYEILV